LDFEKLVLYDTGETGISLEVEIRFTDSSVNFSAKVDTGATACIFERNTAKKSALTLKRAMRIDFIQRPILFWRMDIT
jgi:hypothetical protein